MKKFLLLTLSFVGLTYSAFSSTSVDKDFGKVRLLPYDSNVTLNTRADGTTEFFQFKSRRPEVVKAPEDVKTYTVTPVPIVPDDGSIEPGFMMIAYKEGDRFGSEAIYGGPDMVIPFNLSEGTYSFIFTFTSHHAAYLVVKENVEVKEDMEVTASWEEATNLIKPEIYLPGDQELIPDLIDYETGKLIEKGNISLGEQFISVRLSDCAAGWNFNYNYYRFLVNNETETNVGKLKFWTSPTDKLQLLFFTMLGPNDGPSTIINLYTDKSVPQTLTNRGKDFKHFKFDFGKSLGTSETDNCVKTIAINILNNEGRWFSGALLGRGYAQSDIGWDDKTVAYYSDNDKMNALPWYSNIFEDIDERPYGIDGPTYSYNMGDRLLHPYTTWNRPWDRGFDYFVVNPYFACAMPSEGPLKIGNSIPTIEFDLEEGYPKYSFVGRYDEIRRIDECYSTFCMKSEEKVIARSSREFAEYFASEEGSSFYTKPWSLEIIDGNAEIDGIAGQSVLNLEMKKTSEDFSVPAIMQLQFRDGDDNVCDSFKLPSEGHLLLQTGNYHLYREFDTEAQAWSKSYIGNPVDKVIMEYAPHNSDDYSPLESRELPAHPDGYAPNFGVTYSADLASVGRKSENGWFDLRIRVEKDDNVLTQTVSPAFRITSLAGVNNVYDLPEAVYVKGRDIIAPEGSLIYNLDGTQSDGNGLLPGIYVVLTSGRAVKVVVK